MRYVCFAILAFWSLCGYSQKIGVGFKTGLNFSRLAGDMEENEEHRTYTGFHIEASGSVKITDAFGLRLALLFDQKGSKFFYKGNSFVKLNTRQEEEWVFKGQKDLAINYNNAYISVPVSAYYRWRGLEISGGVGLGFLTSSKGDGDFTFSGTGTDGNVNFDFEDELFLVEANYLSDDAGAYNFTVPFGIQPKEKIIVNRNVTFPAILNGYYDYEESQNPRKFNSVDFYFHTGLSLYVNKGLYLGARLYYSLIDVTNDEAEKVYSQISDDNMLIFEAKDQRFINIQLSLGFNF